ncbi:hypothetical protein IAT38_006543 [Cryptococcus sp. DSM 104549]
MAYPVFHPDHPHNRHPYPLFESTNLPPAASSSSSSSAGAYAFGHRNGMESNLGAGVGTDGAGASGKYHPGLEDADGGIYCSVACARSDAINSLCYKAGSPPPRPLYTPDAGDHPPSFASAVSHALTRDTSSASSTSSAAAFADDADWQASHYRRLARADLRRQERREERRRRRAEGSMASSISTNRSTMMSTSSRAVPDLVGGAAGSHSRNASIASTVSTAFSLSRNPSSASTASSRRGGPGYGVGVQLESAIMEHEDEEEWLRAEIGKPYTVAPLSTRKQQAGHAQKESRSISRRRKATPDPLPFGMGQDMRDVLEEIIQMEKSFLVSDHEDDESAGEDLPPPRLFTSSFAPRTPSPSSGGKKRAPLPGAPGAPVRGHRTALSHQVAPSSPVYEAPRGRPPSLMGLHQSSLSESHTALYLATASPITADRRTASPQLEARRSLTFNADAAGPSINFELGGSLPTSGTRGTGLAGHRPPSLALPPRGFEASSPAVTPMGRRFTHNRTPQAIHPAMDNWRFPSPMTVATPTRRGNAQVPETPLPVGSGLSAPGAGSKPRSRHTSGMDRLSVGPSVTSGAGDRSSTISSAESMIEPAALLWPPAAPNLGPSLFPCSPAGASPSPEYVQRARRQLPREGSDGSLGEGMDVDMDVEMEMDVGEGEGETEAREGERRVGYLPVFLEAEGFRSGNGFGQRW